MSRLSELDVAHLDDGQRALFEAITGGRRADRAGPDAYLTKGGGLRGPFNALLHAPHVGDPAQRLGERLRFDGVLPARQREIAVLCVAALWQADYEWWAHARIASGCGLPEPVIEAIGRREEPPLDDQTERLVHAFSRSLLDARRVPETLYREVLAALGEKAIVELVVLLGYYSLVSMILVGFRVPVPEGETPPFGG
ncbi:MAG: carboxymuconolactone decarboxylase family protein [Gammaproteobacteria bacterium]|nr:carboxymuconolactone decarboxylase family protein [Gammaproteobacteria bacterium]